jgi:hypothetical protein
MLYFALGTAIVSREEFHEKKPKVMEFYKDLEKKKSPRSIDFFGGNLSRENVAVEFELESGKERIPFTKIGFGLPLTIMIREVYTGIYPAAIFKGKKPLLLTSAVKSYVAYEGKPRALNFLKQKVGKYSRLSRPGATEQGTPVVFYSPALIDRSLTLDLSMIFDNFPGEVFEAIGDGFSTAAGIPIFFAQSVYLLAASSLLKIVGSAGEAIFDGSPNFFSSDPLDIELEGAEPLQSGFLLITDDNVDRIDKNFRENYHVDPVTGQVVDNAGKPYDGDIPYVVISVDGAPKRELEGFAPTAASAAILARFLGIKDKQSQSIQVIIDAVKLHNDLKYRRDIEEAKAKLGSLPPDSHDRINLEERIKALEANIMEELLKPKK